MHVGIIGKSSQVRGQWSLYKRFRYINYRLYNNIMGDTRKSSVTFFLKKLAHAAYIRTSPINMTHNYFLVLVAYLIILGAIQADLRESPRTVQIGRAHV